MKLVIFDCDGTIVDSQHGIFDAMVHAYRGLDLEPPPRERTMSVIGLSLPEAFEVLSPAASAATRRALADRYKSAFGELRRDPALAEPLFPGAADVIRALAGRDDVVLGIATGKSRRGVERLFEREGWHAHFATVQTADDHPSKPDPAMIAEAIRETGADPRRTVMIGDTTYDMAMARAAGVGAIGVTWGYHAPSELTAAGAHVLVDVYPALTDAIERLVAGAGAAA